MSPQATGCKRLGPWLGSQSVGDRLRQMIFRCKSPLIMLVVLEVIRRQTPYWNGLRGAGALSRRANEGRRAIPIKQTVHQADSSIRIYYNVLCNFIGGHPHAFCHAVARVSQSEFVLMIISASCALNHLTEGVHV